MTPVAIATIAGIPTAVVAVGLGAAWLERRRPRQRSRRQPRQSWDWPESEWPSPGGWADREKL